MTTTNRKLLYGGNIRVTNVEGYYSDDHYDDEIIADEHVCQRIILKTSNRHVKTHKRDFAHCRAPASDANPSPDFYNCRCSKCNAWLHRQPSKMQEGRLYFCNRKEEAEYKKEHGLYRLEQKRLKKTTCMGPMLRVGGVVYG